MGSSVLLEVFVGFGAPFSVACNKPNMFLGEGLQGLFCEPFGVVVSS